MAFDDLQQYLHLLEREGELKRVAAEVDPELEITEIATRAVRERGPALLFQRVRGSPFPLASNLFGSERRIELAVIDDIVTVHAACTRMENRRCVNIGDAEIAQVADDFQRVLKAEIFVKL